MLCLSVCLLSLYLLFTCTVVLCLSVCLLSLYLLLFTCTVVLCLSVCLLSLYLLLFQVMVEASYSSQFGTFLLNSEQERRKVRKKIKFLSCVFV